MGDDRRYRLHSVVPPGMPVTEFIHQAERAFQSLRMTEGPGGPIPAYRRICGAAHPYRHEVTREGRRRPGRDQVTTITLTPTAS